MNTQAKSLEQELDASLCDATDFLCRLISIPSLSGAEESAMAFLDESFTLQGYSVESVPLTDSLITDPEYSEPIEGLRYDGRRNLRIVVPGTSPYRLIINAHVDVVPPSKTMKDPWTGRLQNNTIFGRGACDDKGQIAVLYLLLLILSKCRLVPVPTLILHLVVEEENGGNGTLAIIRRGEKADGAIVLEPTDRSVVVAARGAVWFRITTTGIGAHSGQQTAGNSALGMARQIMNIIEHYHDDLLLRSSVPFFSRFENPMPVTFGMLHSGDWPASAPSTARLEGVFGFLPNVDRDIVCSELENRLIQGLPDTDTWNLQFTFRHDGFFIDENSQLPKAVLSAAVKSNYKCSPGPMLASSDAWLYHKYLDIPAILFGAGSLKYAHSDHEHVLVEDLRGVCLTLLNLVLSDYSDSWAT